MKALTAITVLVVASAAILSAQETAVSGLNIALPQTARTIDAEGEEVSLPNTGGSWLPSGGVWFVWIEGKPGIVDKNHPQAQKVLEDQLVILVGEADVFELETDAGQALFLFYVQGEKDPALVLWTEDDGTNWFMALLFEDGTASAIRGMTGGLKPEFDGKGTHVRTVAYIKDGRGNTMGKVFEIGEQ